MSAAGIVVDVGGTHTRVALRRGDGLVGRSHRFATPSPRRDPARPLDELRDELFDRIAGCARRLRTASGPRPPHDIGVAFGAVVDTSGVVRDASMLWLEPSTGYDVTAALRRRLPWARPVVLNDVSAAAWHYRHLGRFAVVTVSTGVAVKCFDAAAPPARGVLLDPAGLGGESGHTVVEPTLVEAVPDGLGRAAAAGDVAARAELERHGLPWCECGAVADLCSYTSGPAVVRGAAALARRAPERFASSALARGTGGDPRRIDTAALAATAAAGDGFTAEILRWGTRALAARLLQVCADLGLRTVVVIGGFAHGVGDPWFAALRGNLDALTTGSGWYAGWTAVEREALVHRPARADADVASLAGMAAYMAVRAGLTRSAVKPVGEARLVLHETSRPRCGREQFILHPVFAGICGTDLQIVRGERGGEPGVPGHECVARVAEVGADVAGLQVGQIVTLNPNNPLDDHDKIGHNQPGVFGEALVLDAGVHERGQVVTLPRTSGAELVLVEPLAAVVRCLTMARRVAPCRDVLVVGGGVSGLLLLLLARRWGARTLLANRSPAALDRAVALGLCAPEDTFPLDAHLGRAVLDATAGTGVDTAVIAVGGGTGSTAADVVWPALADGAVLQLFGGFPPAARLRVAGGRSLGPLGPLRDRAGSAAVTSPVGRRVVVMGNRGGRDVDFSAAVALCDPAAEERLALRPLVSHVVSLPALPAVVSELTRSGTVRGEPALRAVVDLRLEGDVVRAAGTVPPASELTSW